MNLEENEPIYANSINRIIIICKEEYYLCYKHNSLSSVYNTCDELDIGKFYLNKKSCDKNGIYQQYVSAEKILAKNSINENVLNNDKFLIKKIVYILEGKESHNEQFKLYQSQENHDHFTFKIILNLKGGITLNIFHTEMKEIKLQSFNDIMSTCMRYFKNKSRMINSLDEETKKINDKSDEASKKYSTVTRDIEQSEKDFLEKICISLNDKKEIIRTLQRKIDGIEDVFIEPERPASQKKIEEDINQSLELSISDLY